MTIPTEWKNKIHVPNQQSDKISETYPVVNVYITLENIYFYFIAG